MGEATAITVSLEGSGLYRELRELAGERGAWEGLIRANTALAQLGLRPEDEPLWERARFVLEIINRYGKSRFPDIPMRFLFPHEFPGLECREFSCRDLYAAGDGSPAPFCPGVDAVYGILGVEELAGASDGLLDPVDYPLLTGAGAIFYLFLARHFTLYEAVSAVNYRSSFRPSILVALGNDASEGLRVCGREGESLLKNLYIVVNLSSRKLAYRSRLDFDLAEEIRELSSITEDFLTYRLLLSE